MHRIMIVTALAIVYNANLGAQNQGARQRIWECYYSHGATNIGLMATCSGYYVTESALGSCLNGFYCSPPLAVPVPPQPPEPPTQRPQRGGTTVPTTPNPPPFDFRLGPGSTPPQPPETPTQRPQRGGTTVRTRPTPPPIDFRLGPVQLSPPLLPPMNQLNQCGQFLPDRGKFLQCAADSMASPEQLRVMNCYRDADGSNLRFASCVSGAEGRGLRRETINCIETSMKDGTDIDACAATQFGSPDVQRLITCASQSSKEQGQVNWIGTAICMAGNTYLTPEQTIVAQCMVNSGGEPLDFVACAGGQLTSRELNKCLSDGIGGDNGCFGNNNSVIIALRNMENDLRNGLGPNNDLVRAVNTVRNDLTHGAGPNNDLVRATNQIGQAFQQVGQQTQNTIRNVFPGLFH